MNFRQYGTWTIYVNGVFGSVTFRQGVGYWDDTLTIQWKGRTVSCSVPGYYMTLQEWEDRVLWPMCQHLKWLISNANQDALMYMTYAGLVP